LCFFAFEIKRQKTQIRIGDIEVICKDVQTTAEQQSSIRAAAAEQQQSSSRAAAEQQQN
jgi:hypothetical protein